LARHVMPREVDGKERAAGVTIRIGREKKNLCANINDETTDLIGVKEKVSDSKEKGAPDYSPGPAIERTKTERKI